MHLFGTLGSLVFLGGFLASVWIGAQKLYMLNKGIRTILITNSPYFYLALTAMIIGTLLFIAGFLGEIISRNSPDRNEYHVDENLNIRM
jgi:arginine exporter protein ArgO